MVSRSHACVGFAAILLLAFAGLGVALTPSPTAVPSKVEIYPLSVKTTSTLQELILSRIAAEKVQNEERATYQRLQQRVSSFNGSNPSMIEELKAQRHRYWVSWLNVNILHYQRINYTIDKMDTALLRLRARYAANGSSIASFDSEMRSLDTALAQLHVKSNAVGQKLDAFTKSTTEADLRPLRPEMAVLVQDLHTFLEKYTRLVQGVMSSS